MTTEKDFDAVILTAPIKIRDTVLDLAWGNSWGAESFDASKTDAERWAECVDMAIAIINSPADFDLS